MQEFLDRWSTAEAEEEPLPEVLLTDGTRIVVSQESEDRIQNTEGMDGQSPTPLLLTSDSCLLYSDSGKIETVDGVMIDPTDSDTALLLKTIVTDTRERMLFCNGALIGSDRRYDGLYCCDEYAMCVYVEDDHLSGWKSERWEEATETYTVERKYTPMPGWGDRQPPAAKNRTEWDRYKSLYPGFVVDVFYRGEPLNRIWAI